MTTPIDIRLSGREATPQGIARALHRRLTGQNLARVELRYSTQAVPPLAEQACKQAIANLLREHGQSMVAVSVRRHEGAIDDATGEHLLRLVPAAPRAAGAPSAPGGWRAWLARWFGGSARAPAAANARRVEPAAMPGVPAVSRAEAVKLLRAAVMQATAYVETDTGTALVGDAAARPGIGQAVVTVRVELLHQVLEPLVQQDARAIGQMVQSAGMALAEGFAVRYRYQPHQNGDGTALANESDVEVRLVLAATGICAGQGLEARMPGQVSAASATALPIGTGDHTAMPIVRAAPPPPPACMVRVLGTLAARFDQPFELRFESLPARFDRHALQQAGLERHHPGLLAVASNQCPLRVEVDADGQLVLHAAGRVDARGLPVPMYFDAHSHAGVIGTRSLSDGRGLLIVNSPQGVADPQTGQSLPALLIELEAGSTVTRQRNLPLAA